MYHKILNLPLLLQKRCHFPFGPCCTGKSTLIEKTLPGAKVYNLLDASVFQRLLRDPTLISQQSEQDTIVVIDEVQNLPELLG